MKTVEGVVVRLIERNVNTRNGPATSYSVLVNVGDSEEWFSFGFKNPKLQPDQAIKFVANESNGFWNGDPSTIEILAATSKSVTSSTMAKAIVSADQRQRSIVWQASSRTAVMAVDSMLQNGYAGLPANTKKAEKYDFYLSLLNEVTMNLYTSALTPPDPLLEEGIGDVFVSEEAEKEYKPV